MKSLRKANLESSLTARGKERDANFLFSDGASSSPRASLAFAALGLARTIGEMLGDLYGRFALGWKSKTNIRRYPSRS